MCAHICDWKGSGERDMSHLCSSFTFYHMFKQELCFLCMHFTQRQMKNLTWGSTKLIAAYRSATIKNNTNLLTNQDSDTNSNTCVSSPHQASVASLDGDSTSLLRESGKRRSRDGRGTPAARAATQRDGTTRGRGFAAAAASVWPPGEPTRWTIQEKDG